MILLQIGLVALGAGLVALVLRDVYHELFLPSGSGTLSRALRRGLWRAVRRAAVRHPAWLQVAGPLALVTIIATWTAMVAIGWALMIWPFMPEQFRLASGMDPAAQGGFEDALYLSLVSLVTLGFGDITPIDPTLRLLLACEAFVGFAVLTAGISWVLSLKPVLTERRALGAQLEALHAAEERSGCSLATLPPASAVPVLFQLTGRMTQASAALRQSPESYYFHPDPDTSSLAVSLPRLLRAARHAAFEASDVGVRHHATALVRALEELAGVLGEQFLDRRDAPAEEVFRAYAADHLREPGDDHTGTSPAPFPGERPTRHQEDRMSQGDKSAYTDKQKRKAEHIEESYESRGVSQDEAERRAWATVNKQDGGGKKSGSGKKSS